MAGAAIRAEAERLADGESDRAEAMQVLGEVFLLRAPRGVAATSGPVPATPLWSSQTNCPCRRG